MGILRRTLGRKSVFLQHKMYQYVSYLHDRLTWCRTSGGSEHGRGKRRNKDESGKPNECDKTGSGGEGRSTDRTRELTACSDLCVLTHGQKSTNLVSFKKQLKIIIGKGYGDATFKDRGID